VIMHNSWTKDKASPPSWFDWSSNLAMMSLRWLVQSWTQGIYPQRIPTNYQELCDFVWDRVYWSHSGLQTQIPTVLVKFEYQSSTQRVLKLLEWFLLRFKYEQIWVLCRSSICSTQIRVLNHFSTQIALFWAKSNTTVECSTQEQPCPTVDFSDFDNLFLAGKFLLLLVAWMNCTAKKTTIPFIICSKDLT
jgi:hypothetical protein